MSVKSLGKVVQHVQSSRFRRWKRGFEVLAALGLDVKEACSWFRTM